MGRWIAKKPMDLARILAETEDPRCGGLVIFSGIVRNENEGKPVDAITYDCHIEMAEEVLKELEIEVLKKFPVEQCRMQHRIGRLELGEASVYVVVRSKHRDEAFAAARYGIDELKKRVPIWKEEHYKTGESQFLDGVPLQVKSEK